MKVLLYTRKGQYRSGEYAKRDTLTIWFDAVEEITPIIDYDGSKWETGKKTYLTVDTLTGYLVDYYRINN